MAYLAAIYFEWQSYPMTLFPDFERVDTLPDGVGVVSGNGVSLCCRGAPFGEFPLVIAPREHRSGKCFEMQAVLNLEGRVMVGYSEAFDPFYS